MFWFASVIDCSLFCIFDYEIAYGSGFFHYYKRHKSREYSYTLGICGRNPWRCRLVPNITNGSQSFKVFSGRWLVTHTAPRGHWTILALFICAGGHGYYYYYYWPPFLRDQALFSWTSSVVVVSIIVTVTAMPCSIFITGTLVFLPTNFIIVGGRTRHDHRWRHISVDSVGCRLALLAPFAAFPVLLLSKDLQKVFLTSLPPVLLFQDTSLESSIFVLWPDSGLP